MRSASEDEETPEKTSFSPEEDTSSLEDDSGEEYQPDSSSFGEEDTDSVVEEAQPMETGGATVEPGEPAAAWRSSSGKVLWLCTAEKTL